MFSLYTVHQALTSERARQAGRRFVAEVSALAQALLQPGKFVAEVESIRKLHVEADRIEPRQPARAAQLRSQAAACAR
jgi:hypothetical protein